MTPEQYERWKDFALRMAGNAFPTATEARRRKIAESVEGFFWSYDGTDVSSLVDWDSSPAYIGDEVSRYLNNHYHEREQRNGMIEPRGNRFESQVSCCIRAGLDMASAPSAGVLGFHVDDLRRMYPQGIPAWVGDSFASPITAETPGSAGVWL